MMELMPGSGVRVQAATIALARSKDSSGSCITYILKGLYSMERLAMSTLSDKGNLEKLPENETDAIKGEIVLQNFVITPL